MTHTTKAPFRICSLDHYIIDIETCKNHDNGAGTEIFRILPAWYEFFGNVTYIVLDEHVVYEVELVGTIIGHKVWVVEFSKDRSNLRHRLSTCVYMIVSAGWPTRK